MNFDKKSLIALIGGALFVVAGLFLKEDVKGLVCGTASPAPAASPVID
jgi:hypothetical protein